MKSTNSLLISLGLLITGVAFAQQPPPPPPPPPAAASQPVTQAPPSETNQQQPSQAPASTPAPPSAPQSNAPQQNQVQQNPQQAQPQNQGQVQQNQVQPNQVQQAPAPQAQNPTEPTVPAPQQQWGDQSTTTVPEADRLAVEAEAEDLRIKTERLEAQQQRFELREKNDSRLRESQAVLKELMSGKVKLANSLLQESKCVIVIPAVKKAAFVFGVKYGRGVMTCRTGQDFKGPWSAPSMYAMEGGNFGFQIGLQGTDLVLLIMNDRGVDSLLGSKVKLGGDMSVAAGPVGRNMEAATDLAMRAKMLAYSRTHGIFAGIALDGSTLRPDDQANEALYGREISARQIVRDGVVRTPANARPFIQYLDSTRAAVDQGAGNAKAQR